VQDQADEVLLGDGLAAGVVSGGHVGELRRLGEGTDEALARTGIESEGIRGLHVDVPTPDREHAEGVVGGLDAFHRQHEDPGGEEVDHGGGYAVEVSRIDHCVDGGHVRLIFLEQATVEERED
jgi:hypothetical protein